MTLDTTKAAPKEVPWFKCSKDSCNNKFQPYHGKKGCLCYECDDRTPADIASAGRRKLQQSTNPREVDTLREDNGT